MFAVRYFPVCLADGCGVKNCHRWGDGSLNAQISQAYDEFILVWMADIYTYAVEIWTAVKKYSGGRFTGERTI